MRGGVNYPLLNTFVAKPLLLVPSWLVEKISLLGNPAVFAQLIAILHKNFSVHLKVISL